MKAKLVVVHVTAFVALLPSLCAARDYQATTAAGRSVRITTQASWHHDCSPNTPPQIQVNQPAEHGTVSTGRSSTTIENADAGGEQCIGKHASGVGIFYTPERGFHGIDRFAFTATYPNGVVLNHQATVTVR